MRALSISKPDQNCVNEDAAIANTKLIAVSDGAGGGGIYADKWSEYLVSNLPETPIRSFDELDEWIENIWEQFYNDCEKKAKEAAYITAEWAQRAKLRWLQKKEEGYKGELFGIVQGNFYKDLRKMSAEIVNEIDFPGVAIGGLSVGEEKNEFSDFLAYTAALLPDEKPRYVMGIGTPDYLFEAVENGIDMFDCVLPTRVARNGTAASDDGWISLKKERYAFDRRPISEECTCSACRNYSRGYLRHLVKAGEISASVLITEHNLTWFYRLTEEIRRSIREDRFSEFKKSFLTRFSGGRV